MYNKARVKVHFRGNNTICNPLGAPKDNDTITQKSGVNYWFKYTHAGCDEEYIEELGRTFGERFKKYLMALSPIYQHSQSTGHCIIVDSFSIVGRKSHGVIRAIKETMFIKVNDTSLYRCLVCRTPSPLSQVTICHHSAIGLSPLHSTHGGHIHILNVGKYGPPICPRGCQFSPLLTPVAVGHILVPSVVSIIW